MSENRRGDFFDSHCILNDKSNPMYPLAQIVASLSLNSLSTAQNNCELNKQNEMLGAGKLSSQPMWVDIYACSSCFCL